MLITDEIRQAIKSGYKIDIVINMEFEKNKRAVIVGLYESDGQECLIVRDAESWVDDKAVKKDATHKENPGNLFHWNETIQKLTE